MSHAEQLAGTTPLLYFYAYLNDWTPDEGINATTPGLVLSVFRTGLTPVSIASLSNKAADNTAHSTGAIRRVTGNLYTVDAPPGSTADFCRSICVTGSYTAGVIVGVPHAVVGYNPNSALRSLSDTEVNQLRHRLGIDGATTAPTNPVTRLGQLRLTQLAIDTEGESGRHAIDINASGDGAFGIGIVGTGTPVNFHHIGHGYFYIDLINAWMAITNASMDAGSYIGNLGGNVWGKVQGNGSATISGTGVRSSLAASAITESSIADNAITAAKVADNTLTAAKIASGALNDKGNWNIGKTGYSLGSTQYDEIMEALTQIDSEMLKLGVPYRHTNNDTTETVDVTVTTVP